MVLNSSKIPVPSHVVGELYIGGIGVSMGYYDKPEMSTDRFVELPDNLTLSNKTKFYRTGDLVKIIGGEIIYVGRNDFQLKIRGHRVELEEIVRIADSYDNIHRSCLKIFDQNNGVRHIVLYVISFVSLSISQMFEYMRLKLPKNHMPSFIIQLPRFPETLNGKIDTKFLPNPFTNSLIRYTYQNHYVGPRTLTEKKIQSIFCGVLHLKEISVTESLLNVGFSSISVFPAISELEKEFGVKISAEIIYQNSSIEKIARLMEK